MGVALGKGVTARGAGCRSGLNLPELGTCSHTACSIVEQECWCPCALALRGRSGTPLLTPNLRVPTLLALTHPPPPPFLAQETLRRRLQQLSAVHAVSAVPDPEVAAAIQEGEALLAESAALTD